MITLSLKRENPETGLRVRIQKGSKQKVYIFLLDNYRNIGFFYKDCSWWIVVGNPNKNKVLDVKKTFFKTKLHKEIQINLPENIKESPNLMVYLISDSYIGLDQVFTVDLPTKPKKN